MKHPDRFRARGQDRYLEPAKGEPVPFQDAAVAECRTAGQGGEGEGAHGCSHPPMVPCAWTRRGQSAQARGYLPRRDGRIAGAGGATFHPAYLAPSGKMRPMAAMKDRLRSDLTAAMKARDEVTVRTLRMALTSVTKEEVAGTSARELSDDEVLAVLTREAKRRREAADAFAAAGREELVAAAIEETGASGPRAMGQVMKAVTPRVAGRAEGARVAAEVRRRLGA